MRVVDLNNFNENALRGNETRRQDYSSEPRHEPGPALNCLTKTSSFFIPTQLFLLRSVCVPFFANLPLVSLLSCLSRFYCLHTEAAGPGNLDDVLHV